MFHFFMPIYDASCNPVPLQAVNALLGRGGKMHIFIGIPGNSFLKTIIFILTIILPVIYASSRYK